MSDDAGTIAFAERVMSVLELGAKSGTYKYALFTAILDLCVEGISQRGTAPQALTTRQLAEKVVELYWRHATPYGDRGVLRQGGSRSQQAEILRAVAEFRAGRPTGADATPGRAARAGDPAYARLLDAVEWTLIRYPIQLLQRVGGAEDRFLYEYAWGDDVRRSRVAAYQRERATAGSGGSPAGPHDHAFDNRIVLLPGVGERLLRLNGILRPLVRREWARMVEAMNRLPESKLEDFLFGGERIALEPVRRPLHELQEGRCFYCDERLRGAVAVDHFVPWSRYPDNGLDNLVLADATCNGSKSSLLAATEHVERWRERSVRKTADLATIAGDLGWERDASRTAAVARATYLRIAAGVRLWRRGTELVAPDVPRLERALCGPDELLSRSGS